MADEIPVTIKAPGAVTADGSSSPVDIGQTRSMLVLQITPTEGDGEVHVDLETSPDGTTGWGVLRGWDLKISEGRRAFEAFVDQSLQFVRLSWTLGAGTTTMSFGVAGEAHVLYATRVDMYGTHIPKFALDELEADAVPQALLSASSDGEDAVNGRFPLPLVSWPYSFRQRLGAIAVMRALAHRGFEPEGPDALIVQRHDEALKWLANVTKGVITPKGFQGAVLARPGSPLPGSLTSGTSSITPLGDF